jgi:putative ABC transport system permease protein
MEFLLRDIRFGARQLLKDKGFTLMALATLAVCIGANAAVYTVVNAILLQPLPVPDSDRILLLYNSYPGAGVERAVTSAGDYFDRLRDVTVFEEQALYQTRSAAVGEAGSVETVRTLRVTPSFFRLLRQSPVLGRNFAEEEGELGHERKVILSDALWKKLGSDPAIVGKDVRLSGDPYTVVGVMPRDFSFLDPEVRLWQPLAFTPEQKTTHHSNNYEMIGRLKPGATREQAQSQVDAVNAANNERFPEMREPLANAGFHTRVVRLKDEVVREIRGTLLLLWGGVAFVLLIGALNVANLSLARAAARLREVATRLALGAGPWQLARQLVVESLLLCAAAAGLGLLLGSWALRGIGALGLERLPRGSEVALGAGTVVFVMAVALLVGVAVGAIPLLHALRTDSSAVFHGEGRTGSAGKAARVWRKGLVAAQVAFALVLLMGAGLLFASFRHVLAVDPGFGTTQVLTGSLALPKSRYPEEAGRRAFVERTLARVRALPGVVAAGATDIIPFGDSFSDSVILAEGYVMQPGESLVSPHSIVVTPGYFEAMGIPLKEGRLFEDQDREGAAAAIIVDERLARKFWPSSSPLGRRMWQPGSAEGLAHPETDKDARRFTVVGVVGSVKQRALVDPDERVGAYYFPYAQSPESGFTLALRAVGDPKTLVASLRTAMRELDPELPLDDVRTMAERIDESLVSRRSPVLLAVAFGVIALLLAAVGLYGVLAYLVAQRKQEIGIRMALGSTAPGIFGLVARESLGIVGAGLAVGLLGAVALAQSIRSLLYGVKPMDPGLIASVCAILAAVGAIACLVPAWRATRVDPAIALRQE